MQLYNWQATCFKTDAALVVQQPAAYIVMKLWLRASGSLSASVSTIMLSILS
jgi:hypothetical protein